MKLEKLNIVFDKNEITLELKRLAENSHLTSSDIARAALNQGLTLMESARTSMSTREFCGFIMSMQSFKPLIES